jgi:hypothetical protein
MIFLKCFFFPFIFHDFLLCFFGAASEKECNGLGARQDSADAEVVYVHLARKTRQVKREKDR